ncbi:MAG: TetR/AcrR family transcriptional regulator [Chromatiales bacterium]|nr:TetR/AcrR family transcriptional regulator [Chromatiales bacterium]
MQKARTKLTPTSTRTREQLILAGERLFAQQGIDNVSLRQINAEAGQRNSSASHYHFGSKESLINAICEYRLERLNNRRNAMLEALPPAAGPRPVSTMIGVLVYPMVEEIEGAEGGHYCIQFLSQLLSHPTMDLLKLWRSQFGESIGQVYYALRTALPDVPDEIFGPRFGLTWVLAVNALADRERLNGVAAGLIHHHTLPVLYVSNLVDALAGMIAAPASAATHAEIGELRARGQRLA